MNKDNKHGECKKKTFCPNWKENHKQYGILSLILAFVLIVGASLAYFTDYATSSTSGTAGTVSISIDNGINLLDEEGRDILNPGDLRDAKLVVQNEGNKSIDVRTYISITAQSPLETLKEAHDVAFSGDGETQSEYELYYRNDVEYVEGEGWKPKEGAKPLQYKTIDGDVINYILPEYSLNGNSDKYDEVETIDGVDSFNHTYDLVFVFNGQAGNEWQGTSVSIDVVVEAKQHENTDSEWTVVAKEDTVHGSIIRDLVDGEDIITARTNHTFRSTPFYGDQHDSDILVFSTGAPTVLDEAMIVNYDDNVLVWVENGYRIGGVEYPLNVMYVSAVDGGVIQANEISTELFANIVKIKFIDFNNFDISTANDIRHMFTDAINLRAICSPDNWTEEFVGTDSTDMFLGCTKLVGAVAYDENKVGIEMANQNGYFSDREAFNEAIKAYWESGEHFEQEETSNYVTLYKAGAGEPIKITTVGCQTTETYAVDDEEFEMTTYSHNYTESLCFSCGFNRTNHECDYVNLIEYVEAGTDEQGYAVFQCECGNTHTLVIPSHLEYFEALYEHNAELGIVGVTGHSTIKVGNDEIFDLYYSPNVEDLSMAYDGTFINEGIYVPVPTECPGEEYSHNHETVIRGKTTLHYCEWIMEPYIDGNVRYLPYSMYTGQ